MYVHDDKQIICGKTCYKKNYIPITSYGYIFKIKLFNIRYTCSLYIG